MATIELYFKPATAVGGSSAGGQGIASHAFLVYRDDDGTITGYSRGGPEAARTSTPQGPGAFGYIVTDHGEYVEGTRDYSPSSANNQGFVVYSGSNSDVSEIKQQDYSRLDQIQNQQLAYSPLYSNSNSVIGTILNADGLKIPQAALDSIYSAPALGQNLLDPSYISSDRENQQSTKDFWRDAPDAALKSLIDYQQDSDGKETATLQGQWTSLDLNGYRVVVADSAVVSIKNSNNTIYAGKDSELSITGYSDDVVLQKNNDSKVNISGQNEIVTGDSGSNYVQLIDTGTSATISGGGSTAMLGSYESLTLTDAGMAVGTGANAIGEAITENNASVYMGTGSSANLYGNSDSVHLTANSGDYIGIHGQNLTVDGNSGSNLVNLADTGSSATVSGVGTVGMTGNYETLTLTDAGSGVGTGANAIGEAINATGANIYMGTGSTANLYGSGDTVNLVANNGDYIGVHGQNQTVNGIGGNDGLAIGGNGQSASDSQDNHVNFAQGGTLTELDNSRVEVSGNNVTANLGTNDTTGVYGAGSTVSASGTGDKVWIGGNGQSASDAQDDHVSFAQGGTLTELDNARVEVSGNNVTETIGTNDTIGAYGTGDTISASGTGDVVWIGGQNEIINGSNETITLTANTQVTINGSNDTINGWAGQDNITINGSNDHFSGNDDSVNFEGNAASDTDTGANNSYFVNGGYVGGTDESGGFDDPWGDNGGDDWDPLVLNLQGGAVQTVDPAQSSARFDFRDNGTTVKTGWGTAGEGYLVDTIDGQSTVKDAADLVSSFASLQKLDSNHDDKIDATDAQWSNLKVWVDGTGTAIFQSGSLRSLSDLGITAIDLDPTPDRHRQNGNTILSEGTFTRLDGSTGQIADVDFRTTSGTTSQGQAGAAGTAANLQTVTQAAQLVSAMSTFGVTSAAETPTQGLDRPIHIPLGVDATIQTQRHAA